MYVTSFMVLYHFVTSQNTGSRATELVILVSQKLEDKCDSHFFNTRPTVVSLCGRDRNLAEELLENFQAPLLSLTILQPSKYCNLKLKSCNFQALVISLSMSPEGSPLDLNNFPEDNNSRDNDKQVTEDDSSSSTGHRKKRSGLKDGIDESGKVYECRFCSLKFYKSQALGGHMNRHRQERETETLNRARQLVFSTDNMPVHHHLGGQPIPQGSLYHQIPNMGDPILYRPFYPPPPPPQPRLFSHSPSTHLPPPPPLQPNQQFLYSSPTPCLIPYTSQYPPPQDYFLGHVLSGSGDYSRAPPPREPTNYTCIGAPVGQACQATDPEIGSNVVASSGGRGKVSFRNGL